MAPHTPAEVTSATQAPGVGDRAWGPPVLLEEDAGRTRDHNKQGQRIP